MLFTILLLYCLQRCSIVNSLKLYIVISFLNSFFLGSQTHNEVRYTREEIFFLVKKHLNENAKEAHEVIENHLSQKLCCSYTLTKTEKQTIRLVFPIMKTFCLVTIAIVMTIVMLRLQKVITFHNFENRFLY